MTGFVFSEKPIRIEHGEGAYLYDDAGTEYLDFGASYACVPVGHTNPRVIGATVQQAEQLVYVQGSYPVAARTELYDRLAEIAPGDIGNVWLCNSGTEANEAAMKFARHATGRSKIVATMMGFHGRTLGSLAATWKDEYREGFEPLPGGFEFVPYGDVDAMADAVDDETAAVILEPIQGEGGVNPAPDGYLESVRSATESAGAAMIVDEIQTGLGRTGAMWVCDRVGVTPDIVTVAKGLANGLPAAATLCRDWIAANPGNHGGTFSGGPLVCAAANATLGVIEDEALAQHAGEVGAYLTEQLNARVGNDIRDVRGIGLITGIEVKRGANPLLRDLALDHGVLALPAGRSVVRLLPPLVVDRSDADRFVDAFSAVLEARATSES